MPNMGGWADLKPEMAMFGLQFTYAGVSLITRAALLQGMSPRVFVVYRQATATLFLAPIAYFSRGKRGGSTSMGLRSFSLIFLASLIGVTINQNLFFQGMYLASSSLASAMGNLVPAITFVMAFFFGLEKVDIRSFRSIAKILGTLLCVSGAISMALLRGPKLLNTSILGNDNWLLGSLFLFASACCWSLWLILQVPATSSCPDHLSLSAWMCFFGALQSALVTLFLEQEPVTWKLHSHLELFCCLYAGIIGSGMSFFVQAWCISIRGPLFSAMFSPLCTVIVTILAASFLHEEIYTGSLIGAAGVIVGLYAVLWGKAKDSTKSPEEVHGKLEIDEAQTVKITIDESADGIRGKRYLEEPLLSDKPNDPAGESYVSQ